MMNQPSVQFSPNAARRVITNSKNFDNRQYDGPPAPAQHNDYPAVLVYRVTGQVGGISGGTPGTGKGIPQMMPYPHGTSYSDYGTKEYVLINNNENTVAVGSYAMCVQSYGRPTIVGVDKCSNLTGPSYN